MASQKGNDGDGTPFYSRDLLGTLTRIQEGSTVVAPANENEDLMGNKTIMHDGTDSKYKPIQAYTRTALRRVIGRTFH